MRRRILLLLAPLGLCGCNFAPEYHAPLVETPANFKEGGKWEEARPRDELPRGPWWRCFNDRVLDELEPQIEIANPDLAAAVANFDQARAILGKAQSALLPTVDLNNGFTANKESQHRPTRKADTPFSAAGYAQELIDNRPLNEPDHYGNNTLTLQSSYELDLWGRVRNSVAVAVANSQANADDLENVRLSLHAELARDYIALRGLDSQEKLLADTIAAYGRAYQLTKTLDEGLIGAPADVARAQVQLEVAKSQLLDVKARRAVFEHAIASLIGKPASLFTLPPAPLTASGPKIPTGAPATLLQRRPDIASAERQVAAANAEIGVAKAAFFPKVTFNLSGGTQDTGVGLLNFRNSIWSLGPQTTLPIFDGGARAADLGRAESAYLETVARYRSNVLRAFQEVEDALANIRLLTQEAQSIDKAVAAAQKVVTISFALFRDGATNYLDVVVAQTALYEAQTTLITLKTRKLLANVGLMVALGGGWSEPVIVEELRPVPLEAARPVPVEAVKDVVVEH